MKLMYFMDNYTVLGGAAHTILRQAELMRAAGHTVTVAIDNSGIEICKAYIKFCIQKNIDMIYIPLSVSNQPEDIDIIYIFEHFTYIKKSVVNVKPDILHSVQLNPIVELVARELDIPHVMNIYPAISDFFRIEYIDIFPKYHICDSEYYANIWRKHFGIQSICIRTVADRGRKNNSALMSSDIIKCVCIGGVHKCKNQLSVIIACHRALENGINIRLHIYGNYEGSSYGEECFTYIQDNNLNENIELKGFCDNMSERYQESDVLICGSILESYPNVVSEALANGVVVISTPVGGVPEVIKDRENGYLSKGYTADDLYEKILELHRDIESGKIYKIVQNAAETYEREHSPEIVTDQLLQYYQWLLDNYEGKEKISIKNLRNELSGVLNVYSKRESQFSDKMKIRRKLWYLYHIQEKIREQKDSGKLFYIWGTGNYGRIVYELMTVFFEEIEISGFIDSYRTGKFISKLIYMPDEILNRDDCIVLMAMVNGQSEALERLGVYNKKYLEDYYILAQRYW